MFDTSRDILNITLSVSVGILTVLLAWLLIYCLRVMKTIVDVSRRIDATIRLAEETLIVLRDRARDLASMLPLVMKAVEKLVTYVGERKKQRKQNTEPVA
jgi:hypothetical protein